MNNTCLSCAANRWCVKRRRTGQVRSCGGRRPEAQSSWRWYLLAGGLMLVADVVQAHPFHVSIADAEFNRQSGKLEVALRVHPVDLEGILSRRVGHSVDLDQTPDVDQQIVAYLRETIRVHRSTEEPLPLEWVGKEVGAKYVWLYFEFACPEPTGRWEVTNRLFMDWLADQTNTMTFRLGDERRSLSFTGEEARRWLDVPWNAASPPVSRGPSTSVHIPH